ncbi:hypothetical protein EVAR_44265_1 [Eumeta japonica]|uniref:Uncharacterized protein n=1 Tax=Eumeta variegata TaxID=151549 RepID=A0A4C1XD16_EUMVA|nr:hypothetical protein EVAR_44265_1 [Eumeta japonica]
MTQTTSPRGSRGGGGGRPRASHSRGADKRTPRVSGRPVRALPSHDTAPLGKYRKNHILINENARRSTEQDLERQNNVTDNRCGGAQRSVCVPVYSLYGSRPTFTRR